MRTMRTGASGRGEKGQATAELAMTVVLFMWVIFFLWELLLFVYTYNVLAFSAKEGVRYAIVHGSGNSLICTSPCSGSPANVSQAIAIVVKNTAVKSFHETNSMNVTVSFPDGNTKAPSRVQVVCSYTYGPYTSLNWYPPSIYATAAGRILN